MLSKLLENACKFFDDFNQDQKFKQLRIDFYLPLFVVYRRNYTGKVLVKIDHGIKRDIVDFQNKLIRFISKNKDSDDFQKLMPA